MRYVVFSMGQFFASDLGALKEQITEFFKEHNLESVSGDDFWRYLTTYRDAADKSPLYYLRMGMPLFDFWKTKVQKEFPIEYSSAEQELEIFNKFQSAWLSMSQISEATTLRVRDFLSYLQEHEDTVSILVSHTNHAHFAYLNQQIDEKFAPGFPYDRFRFITSMDSQQEEHTATLAHAFTIGNIVLEDDDQVVSCLRTITEDNLPQYINESHELPQGFDIDDFRSIGSFSSIAFSS